MASNFDASATNAGLHAVLQNIMGAIADAELSNQGCCKRAAADAEPSTPAKVQKLVAETTPVKKIEFAPVTAATTAKRFVPCLLASEEEMKAFNKGNEFLSAFGACNNCGQEGHWARECSNISVKMLARKDGPCGLCDDLIKRGQRLSKVARGVNMNRWCHERCALVELVSMGAISQVDAERAMQVNPRGSTLAQ